MKQKHLFATLIAALAGLLLAVFGGYLLYEKVGLALISGKTEERVGTVFRADEPAIFWTAVGSNAVFGLTLIGFGTLILWACGPRNQKR